MNYILYLFFIYFICQEASKSGGLGSDKGYGISKGIKEEIACRISGSQGSWFLESNTIIWNFQGWSFVLSGISRVKVKK